MLQLLETRITPSNNPPVGVADQYTILHDQELYADTDPVGVLANDSDPDQDPLTADLYSSPSNGWLDFYSDGSFDYYPDSGFVGADYFEYQAYDGEDYSDPVTVTINVTNQAPVASADSYSVHQGDSLYVSAAGVLANDSDGDQQDTLSAELYSSPTNGWLDLYEDGSFDYYPDEGFVGVDTFEYQAYDGAEYSDPVTVTIDVTNQAPVASPDVYEVTPDDSLYVSAPGVLSNDSDADQDSLSAELYTSPSNGWVDLYEDGAFDYYPDLGFIGIDSFQYRAFDGAEYSDPVTVTLVVDTATRTVTWDGGGNGIYWDDPYNWDTDEVPVATDDVEIYYTGTTIIHTSGATTLRSLYSEADLDWSGSLKLSVPSLISGKFDLSGSLDLQAGTPLDLHGGGSFGGSAQLAAGAELRLWDAFTFMDGFQADGNGRIDVAQNGTYNATGTTSVATLRLQTDGSIQGDGTVSITNLMTWTGGGMDEAGTTELQQGASLNIAGITPMTLDQRDLIIQLGASAALTAGTLTADSGSIISRAGEFLFQGGTLNLQDAQMVIPVSNNLDNANEGSFRWAVTRANAAPVSQTISLAGRSGTITLTQALPDLNNFNHTITIVGPGSSNLTVARSSAGGIPQFRIFYVAGGTTVNMSGLAITNGNAGLNNGGGIQNFGGTVTLKDILIHDNHATNGGGVHNASGTMTISSCEIYSNEASDSGGGIFNSGTLTIQVDPVIYTNTLIYSNTASGNGANGGGGGGLFNNSNGSVSLNSTDIFSNDTSGHGGGINNWGTLTMNGGSFDYNSASGNGGAFYNRQGGATLTNVEMWYNNATNNGGGFYVHDGQNSSLTLNGCTISNNTVTNGVGPGGSWKPGFFPDITDCDINDSLDPDNS